MMQRSEFTNPSGRFEDNRDGQATFVPDLLPPKLDYEAIVDVVAEAHMRLGVLEGMGNHLANPNLFIRQYLTQEAVFSSRIEGTEASNLDVFRFEAQARTESDDFKRVQEVLNYIRASHSCLEMIADEKQIDLEMIKHAHEILLNGVRGQHAMPGKIRTVQNWIVRASGKIENAIYVPPAEHLLDDLLKDLMRFLKNPPAHMPVLVWCAVAHYQFESIHPFEDGNGRVGRLLILLLLASSGVLSKPLLYISAYFERNRTEYYELLQKVRQSGEWNRWVDFFLRGVIQSSADAINTTQKLLALETKCERMLREKRAPHSVGILIRYLFSNPVVTVPKAAKYLNVQYPTAKKAIMYLVRANILEQIGDGKRNKVYVAREILEVFG